jgi:hypothetical protein
MQPTFTEDVPLHCDEVMARIRKAIRSPELGDHVDSAGYVVDLKVDPAKQRFWSPHLNVQVNEVESGSHLYCRFSPRPEVWTMFMFIYFIAAFLASAAAIYGYVQWFLGGTPWALVIIPIAIVTIVSLHAASLFGQGLSSDQMDELRERFDRILQHACTEDSVE